MKMRAIEDAILKVEKATRAEVLVHISRSFWVPDVDAAVRKVVRKYGLTRTKERNAVLIYVNPRRRKISIWGDIGIHAHLGNRFWMDWIASVTARLKERGTSELDTELASAILRLTPSLSQLFPVISGQENSNELSNSVIF